MGRDLFLGLFAIILTILGERIEGHIWTCALGDLTPFSWEIGGAHNSQHIVDPYSFSHLQHGVLLFAALNLLSISPGVRFAITSLLEATWEVVENSPVVIERYRAGTIALGYNGDSILNSCSDLMFCFLGFYLAKKLPFAISLVLLVSIELSMILTIKDSLVLNVLMLTYPLESVKAWQMSATLF